MFEFFFTLKKRAGLGNAIMVFGLLRAAPMLLMLVGSPLLVWREEWLNAGMCFLLGFVTLVVGALTEARVKEKAESEAEAASVKPAAVDNEPPVTVANEAAAQVVANKQQEPSSATNTVAPGRKPIICAMPKCEEVVSDLMHPLCLEHYDDWINKQKPNGPFYCAMPGCSVNTASKSQPLCKEHWREWSGQSR